MLQRRTAQGGTAQHGTAQHSTVGDSTAQHSTAQHSTAQHSTAQHSTAQHSTAQHSTPDGGFVIHGCHWQQEVGDVSNVYPQLKVAAGQLTHMQCVIYVFAAGRINATDGQMPQVFPAVSAWRCQDLHTKGKGQGSDVNATDGQRSQVLPCSQCVEVLIDWLIEICASLCSCISQVGTRYASPPIQNALQQAVDVSEDTQKGKDDAVTATLHMGRCLRCSLYAVHRCNKMHAPGKGRGSQSVNGVLM